MNVINYTKMKNKLNHERLYRIYKTEREACNWDVPAPLKMGRADFVYIYS